jgi:hypothetical protein
MSKDESASLLSYLTGYVEAFERPNNAESLGLYSFGPPVEIWLPKVQTWAIRVQLFGPRGGLRTSALDIMKDIDQTVRGYFLSMTGRPNGGFLLVQVGAELMTIEFR